MLLMTHQSGLEINSSSQKHREYMHSLAPSGLSQRHKGGEYPEPFKLSFDHGHSMINSDKLYRRMEGINTFSYRTSWIPVLRVNPVCIHTADSSPELPPFWKSLPNCSGAIWCPTSQGWALPPAKPLPMAFKVMEHTGRVPDNPLLLQNRCKDVPQLSNKALFSSSLIHESKDSNISQLTSSSLESLLQSVRESQI